MVKATWNHVGIVSNTFCGLQVVRHAMGILTVTVFSLCTKVCWVHQIVRNFEQNRAQGKIQIHCVFTFCSCVWGIFNNSQAKVFSVVLTRQETVCSQKRNRIFGYSSSTQSAVPSHVPFFLQMEEFVFGARRNDPAFDVGVLMDVGAACMMRRMPPKTSDEGRLIQKT